MVTIREAGPQDSESIDLVNRLAFNGNEEIALIEGLVAEGKVVLSLVAVEAGQVVGHILFSEMTIATDGGDIPALALAPMAVRPELQRRGIGSELVRAGLDKCRALGHTIVIVVGHPTYYPRFGFSAELTRRLKGPFSGEAFMALELKPGSLAGVAGTVQYAKAFDLDVI